MEPVRILIADDNPEIRDYFSGILSHERDMTLVGAASSGTEAVRLARELKPEIVLMDIQMETRVAGIAASQQILSELPETKVIILTILEDDDLLFQAYCAGVTDYIIKTDSISQILTSIRNAKQNQFVLRPQYAEKIIDELKRVREEQQSLIYSLNILTKLSNSEFEVLKSLYQGMKARQIAEERYVSQGTVKTQIHSILQKFGMRSMNDVIRQLRELHFDYIIETMHQGGNSQENK
ncbi:MAG: response regulator transcription factor [Clostridia bacterium]|nr:response regulator transcription factor [Clostridia bacterium]